jgi:prevent-host-death family protein
MARTINMHEAKTHLSKLVMAVEDGEEIVIARKGVPVAKLVPADTVSEAQKLARSGQLISPEILNDWEETDAEVRKMFADYLPEPQ